MEPREALMREIAGWGTGRGRRGDLAPGQAGQAGPVPGGPVPGGRTRGLRPSIPRWSRDEEGGVALGEAQAGSGDSPQAHLPAAFKHIPGQLFSGKRKRGSHRT